jgi:hypothetical protein
MIKGFLALAIKSAAIFKSLHNGTVRSNGKYPSVFKRFDFGASSNNKSAGNINATGPGTPEHAATKA